MVHVGGAQFTPVQWANPTVPAAGSPTPIPVSAAVPTSASASRPIADASAAGPSVGASDVSMDSGDEAGPSASTAIPPRATTSITAVNGATVAIGGTAGTPKSGAGAGDEDGEGEDELLPAMADDDYSAQLSWQSESKDNLKCVLYMTFLLSITKISSDISVSYCRVLMDNFSPAQYERFEAYRRHALPKQAVRRVSLATPYMFFSSGMTNPRISKVIQQTMGQQVSQPVAQIVAGFAKVFVGEIVEKGKLSLPIRRLPSCHSCMLNSFLWILRQHEQFKHAEARLDHYLPIIYERRTGSTRQRREE